MFAVTASALLTLRNHDHGLHGNHHAGIQNRVTILAQFKATLTTVIMAEHAEGVAITECAVIQQIMLVVNVIKRF